MIWILSLWAPASLTPLWSFFTVKLLVRSKNNINNIVLSNSWSLVTPCLSSENPHMECVHRPLISFFFILKLQHWLVHLVNEFIILYLTNICLWRDIPIISILLCIRHLSPHPLKLYIFKWFKQVLFVGKDRRWDQRQALPATSRCMWTTALSSTTDGWPPCKSVHFAWSLVRHGVPLHRYKYPVSLACKPGLLSK
jgi:hypothetical protein